MAVLKDRSFAGGHTVAAAYTRINSLQINDVACEVLFRLEAFTDEAKRRSVQALYRDLRIKQTALQGAAEAADAAQRALQAAQPGEDQFARQDEFDRARSALNAADRAVMRLREQVTADINRPLWQTDWMTLTPAAQARVFIDGDGSADTAKKVIYGELKKTGGLLEDGEDC